MGSRSAAEASRKAPGRHDPIERGMPVFVLKEI
jgi:hypothetical protein